MNDKDFLVALKGFADGLMNFDKVSINKNQQETIAQKALIELGIEEKNEHVVFIDCDLFIEQFKIDPLFKDNYWGNIDVGSLNWINKMKHRISNKMKKTSRSLDKRIK
ncbi:MAG: hypothetical protein MK193_13260 [Lentisphaeria bacterium]|nr:hypothetical protein [Lentisphaeria bacterium]